MSTEMEMEFHERREAQENALADSAANNTARKLHREMAGRHRQEARRKAIVEV
ncbi:hypothetical protein DFR49_1236 [Hephaestia caeni]|uniref:Uncharacterized protein n=1 Tax=Hephaestia caeni TaxID=645617 RepID=A0A397PHQ7_9SPHN|nr:hypothetical protein [Hephaestia caeni]RIA46687.1 hypothetical protein DFR49_1236 [Hephaestia caeni]